MRLRTVGRYALAVVLSGAAAGVLALDLEFFRPIVLFPYWIAVFLTALIAGTGPAILSVALCSWAAAMYSFNPFGGIQLSPADEIRLAAFMTFALAIVWIQHRQRVSQQRAGELREQMATMAESIGDAVIATDLSGRVTFINGPATSLTGWAANEAIGRDVSEVFHILGEESRQPVESPVMRALTTNEVVTLSNHTLLIRRDGEERSIEDSAAPIRRDGAIVGAVLVFHDVTRRRASQRELEQSEELFRAIADTAPVLVWTADETRARTFFNRAWVDFTGRDEESELGWGWAKSVHPDDRAATIEIYNSAFDRRESFRMEYRLQKSDGTFRWMDVQGVPRFDANGAFFGYIGACVDITERREEEQRSLAMSELSRQLITLPAPEEAFRTVARWLVPKHGDLCIFDLLQSDGTIQRAYVEGNERLSAKGRAGLLSQVMEFEPEIGFLRVIRHNEPELIAEVPPNILEILQGDELREMVRELGVQSQVCVPLRGRAGIVGALTIASLDPSRPHYDEKSMRFFMRVAESTALAFENARLYADLQAADRAKDEFLATLSHELRTPMTSIIGWASLLRDDEIEADMRRTGVDSILRSARAQSQLIDDVLDVSRIVTGKLTLEVGPVDLAQVISTAVDSIRPAAENKRIRLHTRTLPAIVRGDAVRLQQIVWNLLTNAVKFSHEESTIAVELRSSGGEATLEVTDEGPGIPEEFLPRLFQRFEQFDSSTTRVHGGLGIGLALVRHLAELHGGTVQAENRSDRRGARFVVRLPLAEMPTPARKSDPQRATTSLRGASVLLLEDDEATAEILRIALERHGAVVRAASTVSIALESLAAAVPDVIVSDLALPGVDGYAFLERIRNHEDARVAALPVIAVTAYGSTEERQKSLAAGFTEFLPKPIEPMQLVAVVARLRNR